MVSMDINSITEAETLVDVKVAQNVWPLIWGRLGQL